MDFVPNAQPAPTEPPPSVLPAAKPLVFVPNPKPRVLVPTPQPKPAEQKLAPGTHTPPEEGFDLATALMEKYEQGKRDVMGFLGTMQASDEATRNDFQKFGEKTSEVMDQKMGFEPHVAAGVGTGVAMIPDAVNLAALGHSAAQIIPQIPKTAAAIASAVKAGYAEFSGANARELVTQLAEKAQAAKLLQEKDALSRMAVKGQRELPFMPQNVSVQHGPGLLKKPAIKAGEKIFAKSGMASVPDQELVAKGPTMMDTPESLKKMGFSPEEIKSAKQMTFDVTKDIPSVGGQPPHPAKSTLPVEELQKSGYKISEEHPIVLTPATKKPDGTIVDRHEWSPYQKAMMKSTDPVEKVRIKAEAQANVGFVDEAGQFYTADDYAKLNQEGKAIAPHTGKGEPVKFPAQKQAEATPGNVIKFNTTQLREIKKQGVNLDVPEVQKELPIGNTPKGSATAPIVPPTPPVVEPPKPPLPPGGEGRVSQFAKPTKDIDAHNPITSRVEVNKQLGPLEKTARDQLQMGASLHAEAEHRANAAMNKLKTLTASEPGSKESAALQIYGENPDKMAGLDDLVKAVGPKKAVELVEAEKHLRANYDNLLDRLNEMRAANNMEAIPKRQDYFNHFSEMSLLTDLGVPSKIGTEEGRQMVEKLLTHKEQIGVSRFKHLSDVVFRHIHRLGLPAQDDAIEGYRRYSQQAEYAIHMQPYINELKATAAAVKETMPNLSTYLTNQADNIAGKATPIDAAITQVMGPEALRAFLTMTQRMKQNLIQGNPNVVYSQFFSEPILAGALPVEDWLAGAVKALTNKQYRQFLVDNSPTLRLRLEGNVANGLYSGKLSKALAAPSAFVDTAMVIHALSGKFTQMVRAGASVDEAMKGAEEFAALTQGLLSKTNTPELLRSQTFQALAPFMNQVLAQARFVTKQMFSGKTLTEKGMAAAKMGASGIALGAIGKSLFGDKAHSPVSPTQYVPMGPALERGLGGPVVGGAGRILTAKSSEDLLLQLFRNGMLLQNKIPAGLQVTKGIEKLFKKPEGSNE